MSKWSVPVRVLWDCWDLDGATKPQLLCKQPKQSSCGQYNLLQQPQVLTFSSVVTMSSTGTLSSPMLPTGNKLRNNLTPSQPGSQFHAKPYSAAGLKFNQEVNECRHDTEGLIPITLISFTFIDWQKDFFFFLKGMNSMAVGDGLHWSNFLFTVKKESFRFIGIILWKSTEKGHPPISHFLCFFPTPSYSLRGTFWHLLFNLGLFLALIFSFTGSIWTLEWCFSYHHHTKELFLQKRWEIERSAWCFPDEATAATNLLFLQNSESRIRVETRFIYLR